MLEDSRAGLYFSWVVFMLAGMWIGGTIYGFAFLDIAGALEDAHWAELAPVVVPQATARYIAIFSLIPALIAGIPASRSLAKRRTSIVAVFIFGLPLNAFFAVAQLGRQFPGGMMARETPSLYLIWDATLLAFFLFLPACFALSFLATCVLARGYGTTSKARDSSEKSSVTELHDEYVQALHEIRLNTGVFIAGGIVLMLMAMFMFGMAAAAFQLYADEEWTDAAILIFVGLGVGISGAGLWSIWTAGRVN